MTPSIAISRAPLLALASATLATGCLTEGPPPEAAEESALVGICGEESRIGPDGELVVEPQIYRYSVLDADLAARPEIASSLGFDRVTTCEQARAVSRALLGEPDEGDANLEHVARTTGADDGTHELMGGTVLTSHRGVIQLSNGCTGMLLNANVAVTAAHCLDQWIPAGSNTGTRSIRLRYYDPTYNALVNITNGFEDLRIWIHPNFSGGIDPEDDIGVIVRDTRWNNTTTNDYLRIYNDDFGKVGTVKIYGQGLESETGTLGTLRVASFPVDWFNSWYSITKATSTKRVCGGDSGAPVIKETLYELIAGVHSNSDKASSTNECAKSGGNQRHTRLHPTKIDWIESVTGATCRRLVLYGSTSIKYAQCW